MKSSSKTIEEKITPCMISITGPTLYMLKIFTKFIFQDLTLFFYKQALISILSLDKLAFARRFLPHRHGYFLLPVVRKEKRFYFPVLCDSFRISFDRFQNFDLNSPKPFFPGFFK
ncbi:MAG: hypothetical protein CM1200mP16_12980 [Nitrospina sp.]|nr:MAG: hypothetical protein CM1200mP16_12980 [Nitrospina sp.]